MKPERLIFGFSPRSSAVGLGLFALGAVGAAPAPAALPNCSLARFPRDATNFGLNRRPMFGQRIERIGVSSAGLPFFTI